MSAWTSFTLHQPCSLICVRACGTLRLNRRGLPESVKFSIKKGEKQGVHIDESMIAIKWSDEGMVIALTTIHDANDAEV